MPRKSGDVRWGIVSTGKIARAFVSDFRFVGNGVVTAVASRSMFKADAFAREFGLLRAYGSYEELFRDEDVDMVYVATPHNFHFENSESALRAGKGVLCEKPITTTPAEARELFEIARESGGFIAEAMWTHFLPAIQMAREWVREGRIGQILHLRADFGSRMEYDPMSRLYNPDLAGGCLLDIGVYPISFAHFILGVKPSRIAVVPRFAANGVEDDLSIQFEYDNSVATFGVSFRCTLPNAAIIIGEEGMIMIPDFWKASECSLIRDGKQTDHFHDDRTSMGFNYEAESVGADWLAGKQQSDIVPWEASLAFQEGMDGVREEMAV